MADSDEQTVIIRSELVDFGLIFILRNFRLIKYARVIKEVEFVLKTFYYLSKPINAKFFFCYIVFYEYSYLGEILFGGYITYADYGRTVGSSAPSLYYLMNFNDFASSMVVLFQQMVINNWFIVIDCYSKIIGPGSEWWIRLFFESFWVIVVLILLNIIIAIVLEVHDSLAMEVNSKFR